MLKKRIVWRTLFLGAGFTLLFFLLILRSYWIQSVDRQFYLVKAKATWERSDAIIPKRGEILDRNGKVLAYTAKAYTVLARLKPYSNDSKNDRYVKDPDGTAAKLAPILNVTKQSLLTRLTDTTHAQVELRPGGWKISKDVADKIEQLKLPGITLYPDSKRYYPFGEVASHILGYTNLDGQPMMGIEKAEDNILKGEKGSFTMKIDKNGNQLPDGVESYKSAVDGKDVVLTIDQQIQSYLEEALDNITAQYKSTGGITAIVENPQTGEILAMSSRPTYNPNSYWNGTGGFSDLAINKNYEPGSTFKIVTLSAAIQEGLFNANDTYMSGTYDKIKGSAPIKDHNDGAGWGRITFREGVKRSSNVAFVILGYERLQKQRLFSYIRKFGFGAQTGIELPGEENGILNFSHPYPRDVASMTFGQAIDVTAMQMVAAGGTVANGGNLMQPYLIKGTRDPNTGQMISTKQPHVVRRVVSEDTAKQVRDLLGAVVNEKNGTGQAYAIPGYEVAGKTGTAQVMGKGGYMPGQYIISFLGFAPKDNPKLLMYIMVDRPQVDNQETAAKSITAPVFKSVMEKSLQYLKETPDATSGKTITVTDNKDATVTMPPTVGEKVEDVKKSLGVSGLTIETLGNGPTVVGQYPKEGEELSKGDKVYLLTSKGAVKIPDLTGKTLRDVMEISSLIGVTVSGVQGEGYVVSQNPAPGVTIRQGDSLAIVLAPKSQVPPSSSPADTNAPAAQPQPSVKKTGKTSNPQVNQTN
ncbi:penicillin-binding transpeptidase domain-containing protein [Aneurinibacillus terranovensis]|uniref:penicillin-binding transpeptidase domain-containing protein n=1 Tax=Aneurinibacillus terranovensis TaxID=278991 RepID=UPI00041F504B|nr:penicillin-binding transpeptidase domain-containing protein [Aneurinibacillus terranovensis]